MEARLVVRKASDHLATDGNRKTGYMFDKTGVGWLVWMSRVMLFVDPGRAKLLNSANWQMFASDHQ